MVGNSNFISLPQLITKTIDMKEIKLRLMAAITETMPKDEDGKIKDRLLHSDLIIAVNEALSIGSVVGQSEQLKCYHENHEWKSDGYGGNLKYCNDCKCYV